jgi:hypothetical protein
MKDQKPRWLSDKLTLEEKQALEEEELVKVLAKKIGGKKE